MLLYEFEGKKLLAQVGIKIPKSELLKSATQSITLNAPLVIKAQVLSGKRKEAGGIKFADSISQADKLVAELFAQTVNGEKVEKVLIEERIGFVKQFYLSISYDTKNRGPVLAFSEFGGTGVEQQDNKIYPIDLTKDLTVETFAYLPTELKETTLKLWELFTQEDLELVEINPLVIDESGNVVALDAKIILDDDANFRRSTEFDERNLFGRKPTKSEIEARKIDQGDHRGTAGSIYWDLDGDIAIIAAGGGGSIVNMDALIACGGKPANYTEHSGNPPREKLKRLTKIILSKKGLKGCWFVGGTANFTDIYETLAGFVQGLSEVKPKPSYPIVIRRGGPRDKEAFEMLEDVGKKEGYDFHIFGRETPMTSTAKIMVDLAYRRKEK